VYPVSLTKCKRCDRWASALSSLCPYCRQAQPVRTQAVLDQILAKLRDRGPSDPQTTRRATPTRMKLEASPRNRPTCPLCRSELEGKLRRCTGCAIETHKDCVGEFGKKCPTIGCDGRLKKLKHSEGSAPPQFVGGRLREAPSRVPAQAKLGLMAFVLVAIFALWAYFSGLFSGLFSG
jgi:hypothetical protein